MSIFNDFILPWQIKSHHYQRKYFLLFIILIIPSFAIYLGYVLCQQKINKAMTREEKYQYAHFESFRLLNNTQVEVWCF
jgi:hypothetical protein